MEVHSDKDTAEEDGRRAREKANEGRKDDTYGQQGPA